MRDILPFARFTQSVAFDRPRQDHRWLALVFGGRFVGRIDLARIVAAQPQPAQLVIGEGFDQLQQPRIRPEEMFADVRARFDHQFLVLTVHQLAHALDQQTFGVAIQNRVPFRAPQNFNHVPSCAAERRFQFLNDLPVAAHRPIQPLQIAIDHKNQIVELFAGRERDCAQ